MRAWILVLAAGACAGAQGTTRTFTLVDAGAAPRQHIRYALRPYVTERSAIRFKMRSTTAYTNTVLENGQQEVDLPTIELLSKVQVTAIAPDGGVDVTSEIESATALEDFVDPRAHAAIARLLSAIKGIKQSWHSTPTGLRSHATSTVPPMIADAAGGMIDAVNDGAVVFPDEDIGVGARWTISTRSVSGGAHWTRTVTLRLTALTDATATVAFETTSSAPSQALRVEPNATTRLNSGTGSARGEVVVPLHGLVPTLTQHADEEMNFAIVSGHLRITSTVHTTSSTSIHPVQSQ